MWTALCRPRFENMATADDFVESIDPGLLTYKDELFMHSVTSMATLKFLRPREVRNMNIPEVFKRLLIDKIIGLQSPDTKKMMKEEYSSPFCKLDTSEAVEQSSLPQEEHSQDDQKHPKKLKFDTSDACTASDNAPSVTPENRVAEKTGCLDNELKRLSDEKETLTVVLMHKKDELNCKKLTPVPPKPLAIPGGTVIKTVCDNCHHKGHRSHGNKGNQSCPFIPCTGYQFCGILSKHKEYRQEISEAEKEILTLEKEIKGISDQLSNLKAFMIHNSTNFVAALRPRLKAAFPSKYNGKNGMQLLQKDLRLLKVATEGKIPNDIDSFSREKLENLISCGKIKITATIGNVEQNDVSSDDINKALMTPIEKDKGTSTYYPVSPLVSYPANSGSDIFQGQMTSIPWNSPRIGVPYVQMQGQTPWMYTPNVWYPPACTISRPEDVSPPQPEEFLPIQPPLLDDQ